LNAIFAPWRHDDGRPSSFHVWLQQRLNPGRARVFLCHGQGWIVFRIRGKLNRNGVPGSALVFQGIWITILILLRTRRVDALGYSDVRQSLQQPPLTTSCLLRCFSTYDDNRIFVLRAKG